MITEVLWLAESEHLMLSRNLIADLQAVAAFPQLGPIAETADSLDCAGPRQRSDMASMLMMSSGAWAAGSMNQMHSLLQTTDMWEHYIRPAAATAGVDEAPRV